MTKNFKYRLYTSLFLTILLYLILINNYLLGYFLILIGVFSLLEFFNITKIIFKKDYIKKIIYNLIFIIYIFSFCSLFLHLASFTILKILIFLLVITCVLSDVGGFIFGKIIKGPKLIKISPNKTISGAIGSLIFSSIFLSTTLTYLTKQFDFKIIFIGLLISVASQLGDLFFSFLKRKALLKDTGNLLPGHGGILDRIDGILLGVPFGLLIFLTIF